MAKKEENVLTEEYLSQLFWGAINNNQICTAVVQYMKPEYLPSKDFQALLEEIISFYKDFHHAPTYAIIRQKLDANRAASELLEDIHDIATQIEPDELLQQFEQYLKMVMFKKAYKTIGQLYKEGKWQQAIDSFQSEGDRIHKFTLKEDEFVNVLETFESRYRANQEQQIDNKYKKAVNCFYIPELDSRNMGQDLRGQETIWLAQTGVGKSHVARWIGSQACYISGLDILQFQLEGKAKETTDAYSASLVGCKTTDYATGQINEEKLNHYLDVIKRCAGTLVVKSYPKFGKKVSTTDINNSIEDYKKKYGKYPDIVIVDSLDLLTDASGHNYTEKGERKMHIAAAQDLKDIANEKDLWMVATYQANISDPSLTNDENFVLTEYNCSEAKGVTYPATHLFTLNQTMNEQKEKTMRINVAKSRFFARGSVFKIATDYEHERFYDATRSMNLVE